MVSKMASSSWARSATSRSSRRRSRNVLRTDDCTSHGSGLIPNGGRRVQNDFALPIQGLDLELVVQYRLAAGQGAGQRPFFGSQRLAVLGPPELVTEDTA